MSPIVTYMSYSVTTVVLNKLQVQVAHNANAVHRVCIMSKSTVLP